MDLRLVFSTFALVFLAELGDKTQLAAMAAAAGSKSTWSVFLGASVALVLSTLIAVLLGETLQRLVPPQMIKGGAAALFFVFGTLLALSALRKEPVAAPVLPESITIHPGVLTRTVLEIAAAFEESSHQDYLRLARTAPDDSMRQIFEHLAQEEQHHQEHIRSLSHAQGEVVWSRQEHTLAPIPAPGTNAVARGALADALEHERRTVAFYQSVSTKTAVPALRDLFALLAAEEQSHVDHLATLLDQVAGRS